MGSTSDKISFNQVITSIWHHGKSACEKEGSHGETGSLRDSGVQLALLQ
jgi:hypothetical protein